jgi:hypothetical protein
VLLRETLLVHVYKEISAHMHTLLEVLRTQLQAAYDSQPPEVRGLFQGPVAGGGVTRPSSTSAARRDMSPQRLPC